MADIYTQPTVFSGSGRQVLCKRPESIDPYAAGTGSMHTGAVQPLETVIVRRIIAGTMVSSCYPVSAQRRKNMELAALSSWENEGGATRLSHNTPLDIGKQR